MSLKLIELQVAIPRTIDAAKTANDLSQKGLLQQFHTTESNRKSSHLDSKKVTKKEKTDQSVFHKNNQENLTDKNSAGNKHPYIGMNIDYSG
ncbi:hypothetical protein [Bacillus sp. NEB1478]|uniref:hypothetical protein n=1 Tax=Bacillus sp. NEB1478 TaxID=3073816 RepID=UPI0028734C44|nr:hypothetical protein [Bacillus sp. NEB1478]WNB90376.1 hypothetical protein RGB74_10610 [Bacillus sp. NEB1478]